MPLVNLFLWQCCRLKNKHRCMLENQIHSPWTYGYWILFSFPLMHVIYLPNLLCKHNEAIISDLTVLPLSFYYFSPLSLHIPHSLFIVWLFTICVGVYQWRIACFVFFLFFFSFFPFKWESSDEALKCMEACPSALGLDWPSAIVQAACVHL